MKTKITTPRLAMTLAGTVLMFALAACQGRTADNMTPKGETVEVVVDMPSETDSAVGDVIKQSDSLQNEN